MAQESPDHLALRLASITKRFGNIVANDGVSVDVVDGSWHAIVGENGAGKSTLLNIMYGVYRPDSGLISVRGQDVSRTLRTPADAIRLGVGLVTQHYSLVHGMSVLENIVLGKEPARIGGRIDWSTAESRAVVHTDALGLPREHLRDAVESLSPAAQQKVEIAKALFGGAKILLLDEPTATLAPNEAESLLSTLHTLQDSGTTIVVVTHKLREVFDHSTHVSVLRMGRCAGTFQTDDIDQDRTFRLMIGDDAETGMLLKAEACHNESAPSGDRAILRLNGVSIARSRGSRPVYDADFEVRSGEIIGVAGVDGNGQMELAEAIAGVRRISSGTIEFEGQSIGGTSIHGRRRAGLSYLPADRNRDGLIPAFSIEQNLLLGNETERRWGGGHLLRPKRTREAADTLIRECGVRGADNGGRTTVSNLSGGNQQKVLVGRALADRPKVLVACQPTRGLDILAAQSVYDRLRREAAEGTAILLFSLDLDELLDLSDRVIVMFDGRLSSPIAKVDANRDIVGRLMTGLTQAEAASTREGAR